jgi:predicted DNA-binding transcriptional regulator AlpA
MSMVILHIENVAAAIEAKGLKKAWVIRQLGMSRTTGFNLLNNGVLPKDASLAARALRKLADLLDLDETQLTVQVGDKVAAKTA